ncbi:uncharacterized protein (TIGR00266 family) [Mumia flava]|uniref:Uncharacterized protein (TIGR00266 family) n=1 Tax=Mumia flava TaxID=1348852 RepID=A0A0B2BHN5_9ACTN|nr:TIGR00266 family protein [Mumia flava]PJJ58484.1 uncharacterized protein (TIGR00266 family) [Mumia flava]
METEITSAPAYAVARCTLSPGETVRAESGAMLAKSPNVEIETSSQGGFMKGLRRSLGGESFYMNTFTAKDGPGEIRLAPTLPGDIVEWQLTGQTVFLASGAYLASGGDIDVDSKWGGAKGMFSGAGLVLLKCTGTGPLLTASYGAIESVDLAAGQTYTIDTDHVVGWGSDVTYEVRKVGGWKSTMLSGEGLVVDVTGPGRVYLQTRSAQAFLGWLIPKLPRDNSRS